MAVVQIFISVELSTIHVFMLKNYQPNCLEQIHISFYIVLIIRPTRMFTEDSVPRPTANFVTLCVVGNLLITKNYLQDFKLTLSNPL